MISNVGEATVEDGRWTALMWAAQDGHEQIVRVLLGHGAPVNATASGNQTALIIAAENGRADIAQMLVEHGADVNMKNRANQTALTIAASEGHSSILRVLLNAEASLNMVDEDGNSVMMHAVENNREDVVRELLSEESGFRSAMQLMKLGVQKRKQIASEKAKAEAEAKAEVKLSDLVQLCSKMQEAQAISERICARLVDLDKQLSMAQLITEEVTPRFKQLVDKTNAFMMKHADKHTVTRLVGSQHAIETSRDLNRELDAFLLQFDIPADLSGIHDWKKQWETDSSAMKDALKASLRQKDALMKELRDPETQAEALTLLMFDCDNHASKYSEVETALINEIFQYVSSLSRLKISSVPQWFVPPHEVEFDTRSSFDAGSYGSMHRGIWNGMVVHKLLVLEIVHAQRSLEEELPHDAAVGLSLEKLCKVAERCVRAHEQGRRAGVAHTVQLHDVLVAERVPSPGLVEEPLARLGRIHSHGLDHDRRAAHVGPA